MKFIVFCIAILISPLWAGQHIFEKEMSRDLPQFTTNPVGIPIKLAGNFAELRKNHFHGGIDIKTNQSEGYRIYAVGKGHISRINVQGSGYGNALYIDHPNGYTSVYGHLKGFSDKIEKYIQSKQKELKNSELNYYPEPDDLVIEEGEVIALSGNTGGSRGPHLHFEIRETESERPMNPFLFGFEVADTQRPVIANIYGVAISGSINGSSSLTRLVAGKTYQARGKIAFGVKTYDRHNAAPNKNGTYAVRAYVDDSLYFSYKAFRFSFDHTRYIYSLVRYPAYATYRSWIYQTYRQEGSPLDMYDYLKNDGILEVQAGRTYKIKLEVEDFAGNKNSQSFYLKGQAWDEMVVQSINVNYNSISYIQTEGAFAEFPKETFAENQWIQIKKVANTLQLGNAKTPVMRYFTLGLKADNPLTSDSLHYYFKAQTNYGRAETFEYPAQLKNGYWIAQVRTLGNFELRKDTGKPIIRSLNIKNGGSYPKSGRARFSVYDIETDLDRFDFYIDDQWVIGVHDKKYKSVSLDFQQEEITRGYHTLKLIAKDVCQNENTYQVNIRIY